MDVVKFFNVVNVNNQVLYVMKDSVFVFQINGLIVLMETCTPLILVELHRLVKPTVSLAVLMDNVMDVHILHIHLIVRGTN